MGQEFRSVSAGFFRVCVSWSYSQMVAPGSSPKAFSLIQIGEIPVSGSVFPQHLQLRAAGLQGFTVEPGRSWVLGFSLGSHIASLSLCSWSHQKSQKSKSPLQGKVMQTPPLAGRSVYHSVRRALWSWIYLYCATQRWGGGGESATPNSAYLRYYLINYLFLTLNVVSKIQLGPQPHILCSLAVRARRGSDPAPSGFPSARLADPASSY